MRKNQDVGCHGPLSTPLDFCKDDILGALNQAGGRRLHWGAWGVPPKGCVSACVRALCSAALDSWRDAMDADDGFPWAMGLSAR